MRRLAVDAIAAIIIVAATWFLCTTLHSPEEPNAPEFSISNEMYALVTCRLPSDVWFAPTSATNPTVAVAAERSDESVFATTKDDWGSVHVHLCRYKPQATDSPIEEISFFHLWDTPRGVKWRRNAPPRKCTFVLEKKADHYLIVDVKYPP
jgi:hypothetical protein